MRTVLTIILMLAIYPSVYARGGKDRQLKRQLDSAFAAVFHKNAPGGSILIRQGHTVLYRRSFGLSDLKTGKRFTSRTVVNTGSISKTFVAYGILMLQNEGKLSIRDTLPEYFPEFRNRDLAARIRISNLLNHTSGLPDCRQVARDSIFYLTAKDEENFRPLTLTDTLEFEPGSQWNYSNPAYNGLALIIEKVTGRRWQDFIIQNIFRPSGMHRSRITDGPYPENGVGHGYSFVNNRWTENDYGEYPTFPAAGNGGVWSSVRELDKYAGAVVGCRFADQQTIDLSEKIITPSNWSGPGKMFHSLVWFVHPSFYYFGQKPEQCRVIEHSGSQGGFRGHLIMIPENDMTIIWLTNGEQDLTETIRDNLFRLQYIK
jgi:CubicO group peptidase (beta-lactamase class C family)